MHSNGNLQTAHNSKDKPNESDIDDWITITLRHAEQESAEVVVQIVDSTTITNLNDKFRKKNKPTDVLSFPANLPNHIDFDLLGDIVVCAEVVNQMASEIGAEPKVHWARIIVHGVLHLCGFDHEEPDEAEQMELLEFQILKKFNLEHPELSANFSK